jgi:hypothetical protein
MRPHSRKKSLGSIALCQLYLGSGIRCLSARCAKISRIRCVLSRILHLLSLEIFFAVEEITHHQNQCGNFIFFTYWWISSFFQFLQMFWFGFSFCEKRLTTCPAVKVKTQFKIFFKLLFTLILSYNPNNGCFSKFNLFSNIILNTNLRDLFAILIEIYVFLKRKI